LETGANERLDIQKISFRKKGKPVSKLAKNYFREQFCKSLLDSIGFSHYQKWNFYRRWETPNLKSYILQIIVPRDKIKQILEEAYNFSSGISRLIKPWIEFKNGFIGRQDVENWCRTCIVCITKKGSSEKGNFKLHIYDSDTSFERL